MPKYIEIKRIEVERMRELMGDMTQKEFEEFTGGLNQQSARFLIIKGLLQQITFY